MITRVTYPDKEVLFCDRNDTFISEMIISCNIPFIRIDNGNYYQPSKDYTGDMIEIISYNNTSFFIFKNKSFINDILRYLEMEIYS